jgi:hypothetical protein
VVHVVEGPGVAVASAKRSDAVVEMRGATLRPPIVVVNPGASVKVTNADAEPCAPRAESAARRSLTGDAKPLGPGESFTFSVGPADAPVRVTDERRPWAETWVLSFEHPHVAVTTVDGSFTLDGLPPGHYRLRVARPTSAAGPVEPAEFEADVRAGEIAWRLVEVKPAD